MSDDMGPKKRGRQGRVGVAALDHPDGHLPIGRHLPTEPDELVVPREEWEDTAPGCGSERRFEVEGTLEHHRIAERLFGSEVSEGRAEEGVIQSGAGEHGNLRAAFRLPIS